MWNVHWNIRGTEAREYWGFYDVTKDEFSLEFIYTFLFASTVIYAIWAFPYFLFISMDSQRYGEIKVLKQKGIQGKMMYFIFHYMMFLVAGLTVGVGAYFYQIVHLITIAAVALISFWNGGKYYMEYFGRKYEVNLSLMDKQEKVE